MLDYSDAASGTLPYLTTNVVLWPRAISLVANARRFAKLSAAQRAALLAAAALARDRLAAERAHEPDIFRAACTTGLKAVEATPAELASLRHAVAPVVAEIGADPATHRLLSEVQTVAARHAPSDLPTGAREPAPARAQRSPTASTRSRRPWQTSSADRRRRSAGASWWHAGALRFSPTTASRPTTPPDRAALGRHPRRARRRRDVSRSRRPRSETVHVRTFGDVRRSGASSLPATACTRALYDSHRASRRGGGRFGDEVGTWTTALGDGRQAITFGSTLAGSRFGLRPGGSSKPVHWVRLVSSHGRRYNHGCTPDPPLRGVPTAAVLGWRLDGATGTLTSPAAPSTTSTARAYSTTTTWSFSAISSRR